MRRLVFGLLAGGVGLALWLGSGATAHAQQYNVNPFYYYPFQLFPANYWPVMSPPWPEPLGTPSMRPPAYQTFPPFKEPNWKYEYWSPNKYHRGSHFLLDVF